MVQYLKIMDKFITKKVKDGDYIVQIFKPDKEPIGTEQLTCI